MDAVLETAADVSRSDEGLTLETSAAIFNTASITLINTQLRHQFVFHRAAPPPPPPSPTPPISMLWGEKGKHDPHSGRRSQQRS